ncbi:hypothetical protein F5880DRAFT_1613693 [Lentinula raphanica]|nr:hypothetical protein F5880DRAFT_1613693 [Lentinula raphanica]
MQHIIISIGIYRRLSSLTSPPPFSVDVTPQMNPHGEATTAAIEQSIRHFVQRELGSKITEDVMSGLWAYRWKHSTSEASCWKFFTTATVSHRSRIPSCIPSPSHTNEKFSECVYILSNSASFHTPPFLTPPLPHTTLFNLCSGHSTSVALKRRISTTTPRLPASFQRVLTSSRTFFISVHSLSQPTIPHLIHPILTHPLRASSVSEDSTSVPLHLPSPFPPPSSSSLIFPFSKWSRRLKRRDGGEDDSAYQDIAATLISTTTDKTRIATTILQF